VINWSTDKRRVRDLIPYERNPRRLTKEQTKHLTESLQKFNLVEIPAITKDNIILAGHQCERLARKSFMMELDPIYCQVIIDRFENLTGKKAIKIIDKIQYSESIHA
jgi:hypothetical protein